MQKISERIYQFLWRLSTTTTHYIQFTKAKLLRIIAVEGSKTWFDTNISDQHHFYFEHESKVRDIPATPSEQPVITNLPTPPKGTKLFMLIC